MATNGTNGTNNKYYKSLQDKGYTNEQIDSMINAVSS